MLGMKAISAASQVLKSQAASTYDPCTDTSYQASLFHQLKPIGLQNRKQTRVGPVQDDEALLLFALVRVMGVNRILEIGGLSGHSATVFSQAVACMPRPKVYTVDLRRVPTVDNVHTTLRMDAANLTAAHIDHQPVDLVFLDCHHYDATVALLRRLLRHNLMSRSALVVLHDTGMTNYAFDRGKPPKWARDVTPDDPRLRPTDAKGRRFFIHQPVERLAAMWLQRYDCAGEWQVIAAHDDEQRGATMNRYGLTIMQRKPDLSVPFEVCERNLVGPGGTNPANRHECRAVQTKGKGGIKCHVEEGAASE